MTKVTDYQIVDYGIDHAQFFQGHGTSFTKYAYSELGCGDNYDEALEDALEQAAMVGAEIELTEEDQQTKKSDPRASNEHNNNCDEENHSNCESELYYYVGLRWN